MSEPVIKKADSSQVHIRYIIEINGWEIKTDTNFNDGSGDTTRSYIYK